MRITITDCKQKRMLKLESEGTDPGRSPRHGEIDVQGDLELLRAVNVPIRGRIRNDGLHFRNNDIIVKCLEKVALFQDHERQQNVRICLTR